MAIDSRRAVLETPLDPAYFVSVRLFASSLARLYECDEPSIEDLKIAVSEACANALVARNRDFLRVQTNVDGGVFSVDIEDGGAAALQPSSKDEAEHASTDELARMLGLELIHSLFPEAKVQENARGGYDLHLSIPVR